MNLSDKPMNSSFQPKRVALLGASGSIGTSALDVIAASQGELVAEVLSVHSNIPKLIAMAKRFQPRTVVVTNPEIDRSALDELVQRGVEVLIGQENLDLVVRRPEIDLVLSAIVGCAGLQSTWNALEAGKTVALANKESLVAGGELMIQLARENGGQIFPVDSEHSALYQCLLAQGAGQRPAATSKHLLTQIAGSAVEKLLLTASGGPFRTWSSESLKKVTVSDALSHPTWQMGRKITIDSATFMNKAFEIIEARWLFDLPPEKIGVVIHPQSVVHSMVEFVDGATMAMMSYPDMRVPIQLALYQMERRFGPARRLDWAAMSCLEFFPPDFERFPALSLGLEVAKIGGTAGVVVNAANEVAVEAFLNGRLPFDQIVKACQNILANHHYESKPTLERLFKLDAWARKETKIWISD